MNWKVRHEGSPRTIDNLSLAQVIEGLHEGFWEPTDEVMGPNDTRWVAMEVHPSLAEVAEDLASFPGGDHEEEVRLDMNALIDVSLVLLVFFIIITSYAALEKSMEAPGVTRDDTGTLVITNEDIVNQMIKVTVTMENGEPVIRVEGQPVENDTNKIIARLRSLVSEKTLNEVLLQHDDDVPHGVVVRIQDAAKGAGMDRVRLVLP
jgi:biopolymer transport protein ExbD